MVMIAFMLVVARGLLSLTAIEEMSVRRTDYRFAAKLHFVRH
jgi:hypothetical protein